MVFFLALRVGAFSLVCGAGFKFQYMRAFEINLRLESGTCGECHIQIICSVFSAKRTDKNIQTLTQLPKYFQSLSLLLLYSYKLIYHKYFVNYILRKNHVIGLEVT